MLWTSEVGFAWKSHTRSVRLPRSGLVNILASMSVHPRMRPYLCAHLCPGLCPCSCLAFVTHQSFPSLVNLLGLPTAAPLHHIGQILPHVQPERQHNQGNL